MHKFKNFLQRISPDHNKIRTHKHIMIFGDFLYDPRLWHFNRRPVSTAFAIGIFCAWIPIPFHTLIAVALAILLRCNLPISIAMVWASNPLTMPLQYYTAYEVGSYLLHIPTQHFDVEFTVHALVAIMHKIWEPFLLGCILCGLISSAIAKITISLIWRYTVIHHWRTRQKLRAAKQQH
jgi:uncharacterized protein (DUF2062 family)